MTQNSTESLKTEDQHLSTQLQREDLIITLLTWTIQIVDPKNSSPKVKIGGWNDSAWPY